MLQLISLCKEEISKKTEKEICKNVNSNQSGKIDDNFFKISNTSCTLQAFISN